MPVASIQSQPKVKPEGIPLEKLANSKAFTEEQKTAEAARQFEAVLVRQILTQAQKPAFPSKFTSTGLSSSIYQDMMVNQMADQITSSRGLGLAQELGSQFKREATPGSAAPSHKAAAKPISSPKTPEPAPPIPPTKSPRL